VRDLPWLSEEGPGAPLSPFGEEPGFRFFEFPHSALEDARRSRRKRICVLGGGIAGLCAAYELTAPRPGEDPHEVLLVESDAIVGGRIRTWHIGNLSAEFGPMRIPPNHQGTLRYVREFKLREGVFVQSNPNALYSVGGFTDTRDNWRNIVALYASARSISLRLPGAAAGATAHRSMEQLIEEAAAFVLDGHEWEVLTGGHSPVTRSFGAVSLWQVLREFGIVPWGFPGGEQGASIYSRSLLDESAWELLGRATGAMWEEDQSALEGYIEDYGVLGGDERIRLVDGMDALPQALMRSIESRGGRIMTGTSVTKVCHVGSGENGLRVHAQGGIEVTTRDGEPFDYLICAVPASATTRIDFDPGLDPAKLDALNSMKYRSAAKSLALVRSRRWETGSKPIFGGASYTDELIQQVWYPSDNVRRLGFEESGENVFLEFSKFGMFESERRRYSAIDYVAGDPNGWRRPAILTAAYMTGVNAERFTSLSPGERDRAVRRALETLHPGISEDIVDMKHVAWVEQQTPGGGAWTYFLPGHHERYQDLLVQPHPLVAPKVFFAGEHLCVVHGWMQSAIQAALAAVIGVLSAP
jgi:monoamine oxidase